MNYKYLVQILDVGLSENGQLLILMEYCDQGSLKKFIPQLQTTDVIEKHQEIEKIFKHISFALLYLLNGTKPIIHRDVTPGNILISTGSLGNRVYKTD